MIHSKARVRGLADEGLPFISAALGATLLVGAWKPRLAFVPLAIAGLIACFFRDPDRIPAACEECIVSSADGRVIAVDRIEEDEWLHCPAYRIAVFLSLADVHVNRSPVSGKVIHRAYVPGEFAAASHLDTHLHNEREYLGIETSHGPVLVLQVAGLVARRIVCRANIGDELTCGERFGLIKFGSRTDVVVPCSAARPLVKVGDRVVGGVTEIATWL